MKKKYIRLFSLLALLLAACTQPTEQMPMADMGGMMARHMAPIPDDYAGMTNPITADSESLARGEEIFVASCVVCHGDEGGGDGPGAAALDPAPPPLNHTVHMLSDAYLFYRISEGGNFAPFNSAMPAWGDSLSETERWHVINYMRSFEDTTMMGPGMGGGFMDHDGMMGWGMMAGWFWWLLGCLLLPLLIAVLAAGYFWGKQRATEEKSADS